jgi:O-antigen ligase
MLIAMVVKRGLIIRGNISFPLLLPTIFFLGLILLQITPLPPVSMKLVSPQTYKLYSLTIDGYPREMREERGEGQIIEGTNFGNEEQNGTTRGRVFENWRALSVHSYATRTGFMKIMSYLGIFLVIINYVDSRRKLVRISTLIASCGILVAIVGIVQRVGGAPKIYWFWEPLFKEDASFFGPFVNPNHYAGYIEMVVPLSLGLFMSKLMHLGRKSIRSIREFLIVTSSEKGCKLVIFGFLIVLMCCSLFLSGSRGGMISFLGSMFFLLLMVAKRKGRRRNISIVVGLSIAVFALLIWVGIRPMLREFSTVRDLSRDYDIQYRLQNWKDARKIVRDFPVFGVGLGAFSAIFPRYKTSNLQHHYFYLENDYMQLLCEMGIVGFGIFMWFMLGFFRRIGTEDSNCGAERVDPIRYISLYGCLPGIVAVGIHSLWDFNMRIPSNALLLSLIMGLALAGMSIGSKGSAPRSPRPLLGKGI